MYEIHRIIHYSQTINLEILHNGKSTVCIVYNLYQTAPYSATLNDFTRDYKVTPLFDAEYL